MRQDDQTSGRRELTGEVRGRVRSALMGWTDPVTGDRLRVTVKGESGLVEALEPLGFEPLEDEEDSAPPSSFKSEEGRSASASVFHARLERQRSAEAGSQDQGPLAAG